MASLSGLASDWSRGKALSNQSTVGGILFLRFAHYLMFSFYGKSSSERFILKTILVGRKIEIKSVLISKAISKAFSSDLE